VSLPGQTTGTLVMNENGTGTLTAKGLHGQDYGSPGWGQPEDLTVTFSCS
jgi:hypothetical protein